MSTHNVPLTFIGEVYEHPNADRLELVTVGSTDWQVVVGKGVFQKGDLCIYVPIDSILPATLEEYLFPSDSKVSLSKSRVRSIKLRGSISQGMVIQLTEEFLRMYPKLPGIGKDGEDVANILGVTKYEPPASSFQGLGQRNRKVPKGNPNFLKYTDIENFKYYPTLFGPKDVIQVTEKIHGTSVRYANLPMAVNSFWKRVKKFVHLLPQYEFCYGSRNVQLQFEKDRVYYTENVYSIIAKKLQIEGLLQPGTALYGEIVGSGIQKGYSYGLGEGQWDFYAYDVKVDGEYLDFPQFKRWCRNANIKTVPLIFLGELMDADLAVLRAGPSTILGSDSKPVQAVREGIVIKPVVEERCHMGRKVLKYLNDEYLLDDSNTDNH